MIKKMSAAKKEPDWMLAKRLAAYQIFKKLELPKWSVNLGKLDLAKIIYYTDPLLPKSVSDWKKVPKQARETFAKLGIPQAEKEMLAGAGAQFESSVVYHRLKKQWEKLGVIFMDMDEAVKKYPRIIKQYFMTSCVSPSLHKFAALHAAVWSGGTFMYVPKKVSVKLPLQAYFRLNKARMGQFEHTLIILEEGSQAHYIEGCSAPRYDVASLHAGCVEIFVKKNARLRYSSVENWSQSVYNLNTKRALVDENGRIEWVTGNLGSRATMLYPASVLRGENSSADYLSIAFAGHGQIIDSGAKIFHLAKNTSSKVVNKSLSKNRGRTVYRGQLRVMPGAAGSKTFTQCDSLILDNQSSAATIPDIEIKEKQVSVGHEASAGRIDERKLFYLQSRGLAKDEAASLIVSGFVEPVIRELPLEYAVEINKLIDMELTNPVRSTL